MQFSRVNHSDGKLDYAVDKTDCKTEILHYATAKKQQPDSAIQ